MKKRGEDDDDDDDNKRNFRLNGFMFSFDSPHSSLSYSLAMCYTFALFLLLFYEVIESDMKMD